MPVVIFSYIPRFWKKLLFSDSLLSMLHNVYKQECKGASDLITENESIL